MQLDNVSLGDLRRLVTVADAGSFTGAARRLGEPPRHVSRRIARLEAELGERLFHRTTRSLHTTPAGELWVASARRTLTDLDHVADGLDSSPSGRVRVQVLSLLAAPMVEWVKVGLVQYPQLQVELLIADDLEHWAERGLDVAITGLEPSSSDLVVRRAGQVRGLLAASPAYVARWGAPQSPSELASRACLRFRGPTTQTHWTLVDDQGERVEVPVSGRFASDDSRVLLDALRAGCGIGLATAEEVQRSGLVRLLPGWSFAPFDLRIVLAPGVRRLARVRVVVDALDAILGAVR